MALPKPHTREESKLVKKQVTYAIARYAEQGINDSTRKDYLSREADQFHKLILNGEKPSRRSEGLTKLFLASLGLAVIDETLRRKY